LRRDEAAARAASLTIDSYDVRLNLDAGETTFESTTTITFTAAGGETWVDVKPIALHSIELNGRALDPVRLSNGRFPLTLEDGPNRLVVEATMPFRNDGEGLHRSVDPADGLPYVYGMSFMDAAPSIFACFDQPDLKATYTFQVRAPRGWRVIGNAPGQEVEPGEWVFDPTPPLSTYFVTLVAGPYHVLRDEHDGIPLGLSARASLASNLEADADELFTITKQCFDEFHRLFGIRYPFGDYHQAFVPEFNAGAMENPGCVTFRDPLIFTSKPTRGDRITRATTVAHEMAHMWFGNITTPVWWDDLWLNESFAEYMGVRVTADVTEFTDAHASHAYARRQWGLVADRRPSTHPVAGNGALDAASALQDFDGISYAKGAAILKQLNTHLSDEVFLAGAIDHFHSHEFGNATMHDLFASWERAGAGDLSGFVGDWLRTAGVDTITHDRAAGLLRRTTPKEHPSTRQHQFRVAVASGEHWTTMPITLAGDATPCAVAPDACVVIDPFEDTWAVPHLDSSSLSTLTTHLPRITDPELRSGIWNALASLLHDSATASEEVLAVAVAATPTEGSDDVFSYAIPRLLPRAVALSEDPTARLDELHTAILRRLSTAEAGSVLQLAAFQTAIATSRDPDELSRWLTSQDLPAGLELDLDLRWRTLTRMASLGFVDRGELSRQLAQEPTAVSHVAHIQAVCALPDTEAKAFAWAHFTGEIDAANYDVEAAAQGLWQHGQETLTDPYVSRYFAELPATVAVRTGWVLAEAAAWFFPLTSVAASTLDQARSLLATHDLEASLHRVLVDQTDELARRLATASLSVRR
jgi:aminopeptidase N